MKQTENNPVTELKYFFYILSHDHGQTCIKTASFSVKKAIENIEDFELCPRSAIQIFEVSKHFWSWDIKTIIKKNLFMTSNQLLTN